MIHSFQYEDLNGNLSGTLSFNSQLNIFTGQNGTGKTSILKALWYLYSGNLNQLLGEMNFSRLTLSSDAADATVQQYRENEESVYSISVTRKDSLGDRFSNLLGTKPLAGTWSEIESNLWKCSFALGIGPHSLFFPTFRRVEGGFSIHKTRTLRSQGLAIDNETELTKALRTISDKLNNMEHKFICSVSTTDVERLVLEHKSSIDSRQKSEYENLAENISLTIREWQSSSAKLGADLVLNQILKKVSLTEVERDKISKPLGLLAKEVSSYFPNRSIKIRDIKIDNNNNEIEINSEILSAGEKQLLSFLCYATFCSDHVVMIDEPELSLHLDWQRKLIRSLTSLNTTNQYFFVTHSPAIYAKYSDFEINLSNPKH